MSGWKKPAVGALDIHGETSTTVAWKWTFEIYCRVIVTQ